MEGKTTSTSCANLSSSNTLFIGVLHFIGRNRKRFDCLACFIDFPSLSFIIRYGEEEPISVLISDTKTPSLSPAAASPSIDDNSDATALRIVASKNRADSVKLKVKRKRKKLLQKLKNSGGSTAVQTLQSEQPLNEEIGSNSPGREQTPRQTDEQQHMREAEVVSTETNVNALDGEEDFSSAVVKGKKKSRKKK